MEHSLFQGFIKVWGRGNVELPANSLSYELRTLHQTKRRLGLPCSPRGGFSNRFLTWLFALCCLWPSTPVHGCPGHHVDTPHRPHGTPNPKPPPALVRCAATPPPNALPASHTLVS